MVGAALKKQNTNLFKSLRTVFCSNRIVIRKETKGMPYCSQCGEKLTANVNFCPNCGVSLAQVPPITSLSGPKHPKGKEEPEQQEPEAPQAATTPFPEYTGPTYKEPTSEDLMAPKPIKVRTMTRSSPTTLASVIFFILGVGGVCISVFLMLVISSVMSGAINPEFMNSIPFLGGLIEPNLTWFTLAFLLVLISIIHFISGNWLWQSLKRGGILGLTLTSFNVAISIIGLLLAASVAPLGYVLIMINALLLLLVLIGWNSLHINTEEYAS